MEWVAYQECIDRAFRLQYYAPPEAQPSEIIVWVKPNALVTDARRRDSRWTGSGSGLLSLTH